MKATCTWPAHDVLITLDGKQLILYEDPKNNVPPFVQYAHGYITEGSIGLTTYEASKLAYQLLDAIHEAHHTEKEYSEQNIQNRQKTVDNQIT